MATDTVNLFDAKKQTLNRFFVDLYERKLTFKICEAEERDIRDSVVEIVDQISEKIVDIEPNFRIGRRVLVGSAGERTQIVQPVDYDFQLVLEELSCDVDGQARFSVSQCPEKSGCVHVKIENEDLRKEWVHLLNEDCLLSTRSVVNSSNRDGFRQYFHNVIRKAVDAVKNERVKTEIGALFLKSNYVTKHGPAFTPTFIWQRNDTQERMEIYVDLCPVIKINRDLDKILNADDCVCETYHDYVQKVGSAMLMPCSKSVSCKNGLCFRVTLTLAEILLIHDMSEHHRKCYKLLKYILNGIIARTATVFHSYALKTLVLNHHYRDKCEEMYNMETCVMKLILEIHSIVENSPASLLRYDMRQSLQNIFFKGVSVWNHEQSIVDSDNRIRLQRLLKRLEKIAMMKDYSFEKCYIRSVNCSNLNRVYVPIGFILYELLDHVLEKQ